MFSVSSEEVTQAEKDSREPALCIVEERQRCLSGVTTVCCVCVHKITLSGHKALEARVVVSLIAGCSEKVVVALNTKAPERWAHFKCVFEKSLMVIDGLSMEGKGKREIKEEC